jgi:hypothetical protein
LPVVGAPLAPYHPALTNEAEMRVTREPSAPQRRQHRLLLGGLLGAALLLLAVVVLTGQLTRSPSRGSPSATTPSDQPQTTAAPNAAGETRDAVVDRLHEIFRIRDQAIQTRNPELLTSIFTVDCSCLKGDRKLIQQLKQENLMWRGVSVSIEVQEVDRINSRLWDISALVTTSPFEIVEESGAIVGRIPQGQEISRFAVVRPTGRGDWLLGHASVIDERD